MGTGSGQDWDDAASLGQLDALVSQLSLGGRVLLRADRGAYAAAGSIDLTHGGRPGSPVVIQSASKDGRQRTAIIVGSRDPIYSPQRATGNELFRLRWGADHLAFSNLAFANVGAVFSVGANISDLKIANVRATNVRRFLNDRPAGGGNLAGAISGLIVSHVSVFGFSKGVIDLVGDSRNVLLASVYGDSQRQDGDHFAMGVHLEGTTHNVTVINCTMKNAQDTRKGFNYWNGDGFTTELGVYSVKFISDTASGNTDGGFDIKSSRTTLIDDVASSNKRNFRFWAKDTQMFGSRGLNPNNRGGIGGQQQVWMGPGAQATIASSTFSDGSPRTYDFVLEKGAKLTLRASHVSRSAAGGFALGANASRLLVLS